MRSSLRLGGFLLILMGSLMSVRVIWWMNGWAQLQPWTQLRSTAALALSPGIAVVGIAVLFGVRQAFWTGIVLYPVVVVIATQLAWRTLGL